MDSDSNRVVKIGTGFKRPVTIPGNKLHRGVNVLQQLRKGPVETSKKEFTAGNKTQGADPQHLAKLARVDEVAPPPKVSSAVGRAMQAARLKMNMPQKEVAARISEKPSVVADYESGKAIPNPQILGKLERLLGVKLRGSDIGKELEGPKPKDAAKAKESAKAEIESKSKGAAAPKAKDTSKADSGTKPKAKDAGKRKDTPKSNDAANAEDVQKPEKTP